MQHTASKNPEIYEISGFYHVQFSGQADLPVQKASEKLDQRAVEQGVENRAEADDLPQLIFAEQAECDADHHAGHVREHARRAKRELSLCLLLQQDRHAVIRRDAELGRHIERAAESGKKRAHGEKCDPPGKTGVQPEHLQRKPAQKIRDVADEDHVHDRPETDVLPSEEEHDREDAEIDQQLPCSEADMEESAHAEIHAGKGVHAEETQPVAGHGNADKQHAEAHAPHPRGGETAKIGAQSLHHSASLCTSGQSSTRRSRK